MDVKRDGIYVAFHHIIIALRGDILLVEMVEISCMMAGIASYIQSAPIISSPINATIARRYFADRCH